MTFKPELLSPAGTLKNMRYAFAYGADAVYAGQPRYSLRVRNNEFDHDNLALGIKEAHSLGKKFYVVCNIQPHNAKVKTFLSHITPIVAMKPDALIMSDPGLIMLVRQHFSDMPIHLSVQANTINYAAVQFWAQQGIERVILSRELSLDEVETIRRECPDTELEVFVHGALCMAYSGRCLLSGYINKRDPNQGTCTNSCRWSYNVHDAKETETGDVVPTQPVNNVQIEKPAPTVGQGDTTDNVYLLQEQGRPGEYMPIFEDEHGSYIMNSKDLRAVQHVERLSEMGVHSLKIEGRTKSFYYVARTAQVYRRAIDDAADGKPFDEKLMVSLANLAHRGYTEGFYRRHAHQDYQNYEYGYSISNQQQFVGEVLGRDEDSGLVQIEVKNRFEVGHSMELMTPEGNINFRLTEMQNRKSESLSIAKGSGHKVWIELPDNINLQYAMLMRNFEHNETTRQSRANPTSASKPSSVVRNKHEAV